MKKKSFLKKLIKANFSLSLCSQEKREGESGKDTEAHTESPRTPNKSLAHQNLNIYKSLVNTYF
uniref:Uncharacterized protein n=1 Tax=Astyanax mexicanus TaxID=7994 RepID=A0A3B1KM26_ASTMX